MKPSENPLGSEPVSSLLRRFAIPSVIAMLVSALYNMVDQLFIGHSIGVLGNAATNVAFPLSMVCTSIGLLCGIGGAANFNLCMGRREPEHAKSYVGSAISMLAILGVILCVAVQLFLRPMMLLFGATPDVIDYACTYTRITSIGFPFLIVTIGGSNLIRADGSPKFSMLCNLVGAIVNTILDPLFIFGFGWGIRGAAIATVLAQILALVWQFRIFSDRNELLHFRRGIYRLKGKIVRNVLAIGMSPFLMNLAACFIVILINKGLKEYGGDLNIGAYGIVNRLGFFFVMIVMGINQGMQPIAGYNYGARQFDRVDRVLKLTIIGATCVTTLGFLIGELAPRLAVSVFTDDPELVRLSAEGMRIVFFCFPIIGFQMVTTNFFQSIGMAGKAIFLSLSRQLLFLMPGLIFLPRIFDELTPWDGSWGVWCSMPLSDFLASLVAGVMLFCQFRKFKAKAAAGRGEVSGAEVENDRRVNE